MILGRTFTTLQFLGIKFTFKLFYCTVASSSSQNVLQVTIEMPWENLLIRFSFSFSFFSTSQITNFQIASWYCDNADIVIIPCFLLLFIFHFNNGEGGRESESQWVSEWENIKISLSSFCTFLNIWRNFLLL